MEIQSITSFQFKIGSYMGSSATIHYSKHTVTHNFGDSMFALYRNPNLIERTVTEDDLKPLIALLPIITSWERHNYAGVADGVEWEFRIHSGRHQIIRAGHMAFPKGFDSLEFILEQLIGRKIFGN